MNPFLLWVLFIVFVGVMLWLDFRLFSGKEKEVGVKEALLWSAFWLGLALAFNVGVFFFSTPERATNFLTGYLVERALSMDNIFVFLLIFNYFRIPAAHQQIVLFWGILLALVLRVIFITAGVVIINTFHWSIYILGFFLVFVGIKMAFSGEKEEDLSTNSVLGVIKKFFPITDRYNHQKFFLREKGVLLATPLFVVFLMVAAMDVVFAVDSIPAILAITTDPFVVFTSNIFAILGLRALFSAVAALAKMFHYLNYGLSFILAFIGIKMILSDIFHIPVIWVLAVVGSVLLVSVLASVSWPKPEAT